MTSKVLIGSHHIHWNTQIVCELSPEPGDIVVPKHRFSGFYGTDLVMILRGLVIEYLVFDFLHHECLRRIDAAGCEVSGAYSWPRGSEKPCRAMPGSWEAACTH